MSSFRPRTAEVRALSTVLDSEHDSVDDLSKAVIHKCFDLLMERELWLVLLVYPDQVWAHGPYFSRRQAEKACLDNVFQVRGECRMVIRRLITALPDGGDDE